jgi:hypothetical protein
VEKVRQAIDDPDDKQSFEVEVQGLMDMLKEHRLYRLCEADK